MQRKNRPILHPVLAGFGTMGALSVLFLAGLDSDVQSVPLHRKPAFDRDAPDKELPAQKQQIPSPTIKGASQFVLQDAQRQFDTLRQQEGMLREVADRLQQLKQLTNELKRAQT